MKEARNLILGIPLASSNDFVKLRPNFDRRSIAHRIINLLDLGIRDRDAARGPIAQPMSRPQCTSAVRQAVNHDVAAWRHAGFSGSRIVFRGWIRNVQRSMESTVMFVKINDVNSFRCPPISLALLWPYRRETEGNTIFLQLSVGGKQN